MSQRICNIRSEPQIPTQSSNEERGYVECPSFHFSAQILSVCQQLHLEGTPLLYQENSLRIHAYYNYTFYDALRGPFFERETEDYERESDNYAIYPVIPLAVHLHIRKIDLEILYLGGSKISARDWLRTMDGPPLGRPCTLRRKRI